MANPHDHPTALKDLQDSIYREKVLRARAMTPEQRLTECFELTNRKFEMMLAEAMARPGITDETQGWNEVSRELDRLRFIEDEGLYVSEKLG